MKRLFQSISIFVFEWDNTYVTVNVLHFVRDWLERSIKSSGAAGAPFLKARKVA